ncbi:MAG: PilZ domain-containing protein [Terriglobales bacterium]
MEKDRRQFLRIQVPADAEALDEQGKKLGQVEEAGGGGMRIRMNGGATAPAVGSRLKITVVEPGTNHVIHTVSVLVRYRQGATLGLEFVSEGAAAGPA